MNHRASRRASRLLHLFSQALLISRQGGRAESCIILQSRPGRCVCWRPALLPSRTTSAAAANGRRPAQDAWARRAALPTTQPPCPALVSSSSRRSNGGAFKDLTCRAHTTTRCQTLQAVPARSVQVHMAMRAAAAAATPVGGLAAVRPLAAAPGGGLLRVQASSRCERVVPGISRQLPPPLTIRRWPAAAAPRPPPPPGRSSCLLPTPTDSPPLFAAGPPPACLPPGGRGRSSWAMRPT